MNVSSVGTTPSIQQPTPSLESKRAALQSMLLKKSLETQQQSAEAITREVEGKGQALDIRV